MDVATADLSRPSLARVYVELDLTIPRIPVIFIEADDFTLRQTIIYENCPQCCSLCKHLGHEQANCLSKNKGDSTKIISTNKKIKSKNKEPEAGIEEIRHNEEEIADKRKTVSFAQITLDVAENSLENQDVRKDLIFMKREDIQHVAQGLEKSTNKTPKEFRRTTLMILIMKTHSLLSY
ncbi:UNVERIFIED_CONTAM: hypothetical protein Sradi_5303200 [Sesamum radiatum]|uniref:Uncharacterized protein n=1 Tax=Sesamum radiatum TaxID=300843 RepID=A0AAW2LMA5_SESRA